MDYRIFSVRRPVCSFCMHVNKGDLGLWSHSKDFCSVCTELDSRNIGTDTMPST